MERFAQLEQTIVKVYVDGTEDEKTQGRNALSELVKPEGLNPICMLLEHSNSTHSWAFASQAVGVILERFWPSFPKERVLELRTWLCTLLHRRCNTYPSYVRERMMQAAIYITRSFWRQANSYTDCQENRPFIDQTIPSFFSASIQRHMGLDFWKELVQQMRLEHNTKGEFSHRVASYMFRDTYLLKILKTADQTFASFSSMSPQEQESLLSLTVSCVESITDCTNNTSSKIDVVCSSRTKEEWKQYLQCNSLVASCVQAFRQSKHKLALQVLVHIPKLYRTIFDESTYNKGLLRIHMQMTSPIVQMYDWSDTDVYHTYVQFLHAVYERISFFQEFDDGWMMSAVQFSMFALQKEDINDNSVFDIVHFWCDVIGLQNIFEYTLPQSVITNMLVFVQTYIANWIKRVPRRIQEGEVDFLFDETRLEEYHNVGVILLVYGEPILPALQSQWVALTRQWLNETQRTKTLEIQLAFLTRMLSSCSFTYIHERIDDSKGIQREQRNAEFCALVFQLAKSIQSQNITLPYLISAILEDFESFPCRFLSSFWYEERTKVPDHPFYNTLSNIQGPTTQYSLLSVIWETLHFVLRRVLDTEVLCSALKVMKKLLNDSHLSKVSLSHPLVQQMIQTVESTNFFLQPLFPSLHPCVVLSHPSKSESFGTVLAKYGKIQASFFQILASLQDAQTFPRFMQALQPYFTTLHEATNLRDVRIAVSGVMLSYILRGIIVGLKEPTLYRTVLEFLFLANGESARISQLMRLLNDWWQASAVSTPILKLWVELVNNRNNYISLTPFGPSLQKACCSVLQSYGTRLLSIQYKQGEASMHKLKGINLCLRLFTNLIMWGDCSAQQDSRALMSASISSLMELLQSVPQKEFLMFPKTTSALFGFLENLIPSFFQLLDTKALFLVFSFLRDGLYIDKTEEQNIRNLCIRMQKEFFGKILCCDLQEGVRLLSRQFASELFCVLLIEFLFASKGADQLLEPSWSILVFDSGASNTFLQRLEHLLPPKTFQSFEDALKKLHPVKANEEAWKQLVAQLRIEWYRTMGQK